MVAPGFLQNPEVRRWLTGVEPAWTMLDFDTFNALRYGPSASNPVIRPEANLTDLEISASAITPKYSTAPSTSSGEGGGLKLTVTAICAAP